MPFLALCCESEAILSKEFRSGYPGWSVHKGKFSSRKNGDLGNRVSPASHTNTSKFLRRKEWRGDFPETEPPRSTGLARLPGRILLSVHMGNFSPVDRDEIQETQPRWWNINLYRSRLSQLCGLL